MLTQCLLRLDRIRRSPESIETIQRKSESFWMCSAVPLIRCLNSQSTVLKHQHNINVTAKSASLPNPERRTFLTQGESYFVALSITAGTATGVGFATGNRGADLSLYRTREFVPRGWLSMHRGESSTVISPAPRRYRPLFQRLSWLMTSSV